MVQIVRNCVHYKYINYYMCLSRTVLRHEFAVALSAIALVLTIAEPSVATVLNANCKSFESFLDIIWNHRGVSYISFNTFRPRQNGCDFADDIFKCIFLNKIVRISIKISLDFVPKGRNNNIPAMVPIMTWRRPGDKPLSEPMMVSLLTHICVTQPQWVKNGILAIFNKCWQVASGIFMDL